MAEADPYKDSGEWRVANASCNTFAELAAATAATAGYTEAANPEAVLRRGLAEEVGEYVDVHDYDPYRVTVGAHQVEAYDRCKERGDILYYVAEIARYKFGSLHEVLGLEATDTLGAYQQMVSQDMEPRVMAESPFGRRFAVQDFPTEVLTVAALRVIDAMNPRPGQGLIWLGVAAEDRHDTRKALADLMWVLAKSASYKGESLQESIELALWVNAGRSRQNKILSRDKYNAGIESDRGRLVAGFVMLVTSRLAIERLQDPDS